MKLYLLNYNNYFNRQIKRESTLAAYLVYQVGATQIGVNFNPNDGVDTTHVIGKADYTGNPDYCIVTTDKDVIQSRWFVLDGVRTRGGQYNLQLHRDVIVDHYSQVLSAPCYVKRGYISNIADSAIFNSENIKFNQIKRSETLFTDPTECGWIAVYFTPISSDAGPNQDGIIPVTFTPKYDVSASYTSITDFNSQFSYSGYTDATAAGGSAGTTAVVQYALPESVDIYARNTYNLTHYKWPVKQAQQYTFEETALGNTSQIQYNNTSVTTIQETLSSKINPIYYDVNESLNSAVSSLRTNIQSYDGKVIAIGGSYYQYQLVRSSDDTPYFISASSTAFTTIKTALTDYEFSNLNNADGSSFGCTGRRYFNKLVLRALAGSLSITVNFTSSANKLAGQPYCMATFPYGGYIRYWNVGIDPYISQELALNLASAISEALGSYVVDIQLLPFCPVQERILPLSPHGTQQVVYVSPTMIANQDYNNIVQDGGNIGAIFFANSDSFTVNLGHSISTPTSPIQFKVGHETEMYRLVSPNQNGVFEFSAEANGGVSTFWAKCTYKPFNPYIYIYPEFGNLYGSSFNDGRGLICGGQFSLPQVSDQWVNYCLNNINYENSFNRQTESLELQNKYAKVQDWFNMFSGTATAAAGGALAGARFGGPYGAIGGAIAGGTLGLAGGIADVSINNQLRQDQMDLRQDLQQMDWQNIQARPDSITKISAFDISNKIFPVLEFYSSTQEEKTALTNYLVYNAMTVNRIGYPGQYGGGYFFQGDAIRITINDDAHVAEAINNELRQGVYLI